jgi:hypothetical protein
MTSPIILESVKEENSVKMERTYFPEVMKRALSQKKKPTNQEKYIPALRELFHGFSTSVGS